MSIDDRDYVRADPQNLGPGTRLSFRWIVVGLTAAGFLAQASIENGVPHDGERFVLYHLALSLDGVMRGELWQPFTYMLLHGGLGHLVLNMMALFVVSTVIGERISDAAQARLYVLGGVAGAAGCLLWSVAGLPGGGRPVVGASGAVTALLVGAALKAPSVRIPILVLQVPIWLLATLFVGFDLACALVQAMSPSWMGEVAVQAHLGGAALGVASHRLGMVGASLRKRSAGRVPCPECGKPLERGAPVCPRCGWVRGAFPAPAPAPDPDAARVDALLERIQTSGIGSLTPEEREFLNRAAARLRERKR